MKLLNKLGVSVLTFCLIATQAIPYGWADALSNQQEESNLLPTISPEDTTSQTDTSSSSNTEPSTSLSEPSPLSQPTLDPSQQAGIEPVEDYSTTTQPSVLATTPTVSFPNGIYLLDNADSSKTTEENRLGLLYDPNIDWSFVNGFAWRIDWKMLINGTSGPNYDFHMVDEAIKRIQQLGKTLTITIKVQVVPQYVLNDPRGVETYITTVPGPGDTTQQVRTAVPWDLVAQEHYRNFIRALAGHQIDGVALRDHSAFAGIRASPIGMHGIRNTANGLFSLPTYERNRFIQSVLGNLDIVQQAFPSKSIWLMYFSMNDQRNRSYGGRTLNNDLLSAIDNHFDGQTRPVIGLFQENLKQGTPDPTSIGGKNLLTGLANGSPIMFQACDAWTNTWCTHNAGDDSPGDGIGWGYTQFQAKYFEIYAPDLRNTTFRSELENWNDTLTPDTTPPVISDVKTTSITPTSVIITWTTNEPSTTSVKYGLDTTYLYSIGDSALVTNHSVTLTGLTAATTYYYRVKSVDEAGNEARTVDLSFKTLNTPPVINTLTNNAVDRDTTQSGTQVYEGDAVTFSATASDPDGQPLNWTWYYRVNGGSRVLHSQGRGVIQNAIFTYPTGSAGKNYEWILSVSDGIAQPVEKSKIINVIPQSDTTPPVITNVGATPVDPTTVTITWTTNEPSTTSVKYGLDTTYPYSVGDSALVTNHSVTLTGLTSNTTYYYRVKSVDAAGNEARQLEFTFTTPSDVVPLPQFDPPQIIGGLNVTVPELSGIIASRQNPDVLWVHSDGKAGRPPYVWAINSEGKMIEVLRLPFNENKDWEDIAIGRSVDDPGHDYVYIAYTGWNSWETGNPDREMEIYRFREPSVPNVPDPTPGSFTPIDTSIETIKFRYPDGKHNAESMFIDPWTGNLFIIEKNGEGSSGAHRQIYMARADQLHNGAHITLTEVGYIDVHNGYNTMPTAADISADGHYIVVKTGGDPNATDPKKKGGETYVWVRQNGQSIIDVFNSDHDGNKLPYLIQGEAMTFAPWDGNSLYSKAEGGPLTYTHMRTAASPTMATTSATTLAVAQIEPTSSNVLVGASLLWSTANMASSLDRPSTVASVKKKRR